MKNRCKTQIQVSLILSAILMVALGATTVFATNYYVATDGDDQDPGTLAEPFATIQHAADVMSAGDTCYIREGTYREDVTWTTDTLTGTEANPITFTNYQDEEVTIDGTDILTGTWTQHSGNIYKKSQATDIWQLFDDGAMMVSCRWPNETFDTLWGNDNMWAYGDDSGDSNGRMYDVPHDGIDLTDLNFSVNGAMGLLNVGSFKTAVSPITGHTAGSNRFDYTPVEFVYEDVHHRYFLECKLDLLDAETEWYYDSSGDMLYLWAPEGGSPSGTIEGKTRSYGFDISGCDYIVIDGIDFRACTFRLDNCERVTIKNCDFTYPSYSKRMLGSTADIDVTLFGDTGARELPANNTLYNCSFAYSDGIGINVQGMDNTIENCLFHDIDFSCPVFRNNSKTIKAQFSTGLTFKRNTMYNTCNSACFRAGIYVTGHPTLVELNHAYNIGLKQNDGAAFQVPADCQDGVVVRYNWSHDHKRRGYRFDGRVSKGIYGTNGLIHHNVAWEVGNVGYRIKGESHKVYNNLGFQCDLMDLNVWDEDGTANQYTITRNCAADEISGENDTPTPLPGTESNNWTGYTKGQLEGANRRDFRPTSSSDLRDGGTVVSGITDGYLGTAPDIGAYEYGCTNYWIPGRKEEKACSPIPPDDATDIPTSLDLIWLEGLNATSSNIYFGTASGSLTYQANQSTNIYDPGTLSSDITYYWRVDTVTASDTIAGDEWSFYTGVPPGSEATTVCTDDTFVNSGNPSTTQGGDTEMRVRNIDWKRSYVMYTVSGSGGNVSSAVLRMKTDATNIPPNTQVYEVTGSWDESTLTWNNDDLTWGSQLDSVGQTTGATWYEFDVTSWITGDGTFSFGLVQTVGSPEGWWLTKESAYPHDLIVTAGAPDTTPPAAPTGLSATGGDSEVSLDWNDNSEEDLDGYNVYRTTSQVQDYYKINASLVSASDYTDSTVSNNTTYWYVVRAVDTSSNESSSSIGDSAVPQADTTPPANPTGLGATPGDSQVALDWDDNTEGDLDGYNVYRSTTSGSGFSKINGSLVSPSDYTDSTASNDTTYYYKVTAVDVSENESGYSSEVSATPSAPATPAAPSDLTATAVSKSQIDLEWVDNSDDEDGFKIECSEDDNSNFEQIDTVGANVTTYNSTGLKKETTYYYRVRAYNGVGDSSYSNEAYDTTPKK